MKRYLMIGLALGLLVGLSLPAEGASDKPKRGGTLRLAIRKDLVLKNPLVRTRSTDHLIRHLMFESLLELDHQGRIQPNLAESWEVSKDGKLYTFNLRKGVIFHNGQEMTAEDAKFAIDYTINPKNGASGKRRLNQVKGAEVVGKYTLKVYMKKATPSFLSSLTDINSFSVIPNGSLPEGVSKIDSFPLGTGPFKFIAWKANQHIVLERFDNYWGHKAHGGSMDPDPWSTYAGGLICPPDLRRRITNSRGYCNRQVETLARKAEVELDEKSGSCSSRRS